MEKIIYFARKLKSFTFDDIFLLAETEKEKLLKSLEKLVQDGIIKKTAQGFVFIQEETPLKFEISDEKIMSAKSAKICKKQKIKKKEITTYKDFTADELKEIPEYNLRKFNKYINLLKLTNGLYGTKLKNFIKDYNLQHPKEQTSYASILRMRKNYIKKGNSSLVGQYGKSRVSIYDDKFFQLFKKLYFSSSLPTYKQCRQEIAEYYNIPLEESPSIMHYRRKLMKEMTSDEVKKLRCTLCF